MAICQGVAPVAPPGPAVLCLGNGRFRVRAEWREEGWTNFRRARAAPLTRDTGTFWFYGADNVELVVKVLDACNTPWNRYWVFVAGLTNLGVQLIVDDLEHDQLSELA